MDYVIANIRISLPDAFADSHFTQALAPFAAGAGNPANSRIASDTTTSCAPDSGNAAADNCRAKEHSAADNSVAENPASKDGRAGHSSAEKYLTTDDNHTGKLPKAENSSIETHPSADEIPALCLCVGNITPEQSDYRHLSSFDFPDADADCRFGHDSAGYLFEMTPRSGEVPARFRMALGTSKAVSDITQAHNPALFRFGVWMLFNIAAAERGAVAVHSSVIACNGGAVLFLGESGTGKSTHTRLWREHIPGTALLNDDSPIVCIHPKKSGLPDVSAQPGAYVSGSPWSGKTPCYKNRVLPIRAIIRLSQAPHNRIRRLAPIEAIGALLPSCPPAFAHDEPLQDAVCATISTVLSQVPTYHLECLPDAAAAQLAFDTVFTPKNSSAK